MSDFDRGYGMLDQYRRSASGHSPTTSRSYRMAVDQSHREEVEAAPAKRDSSTRRQENNTQEDYLSPLIPSSRKGRGRVDSLSSIGSSVAPAALPRHSSRNYTSSRHQNRDGMSPSTSTATSSGGGLEAWLQSQAVASSNGHESFPSFAPSSRVRKMNAVDETEIGSDAGRSIGARSAGPRINGTGSGRSNRERQKRSAIPEWDPTTFDGDAAGLGALSNPDAQKLENVLRWRKDSTSKSIAKERNDMSDLDHIAPESRRRRREMAGSFSASGLSVLREGVRRPRKLNAEPSLDALLSTSITEQNNGMRIPSSRSFGGNSIIAGNTTSARDPMIIPREKEKLEDQGSTSSLRSFVRWFLLEGSKSTTSGEGRTSEGGMILMSVTAVLISVLFKWIVGLGNWSGKGIPPLYGDFEAQRHWMEITLHLPRSQWYYYDQSYWGLDYPPLTAIVSQWCAQVATLIPGLSPSLALDTSRGDESPILVVFMRATVLVLDLVVYTPAILFFLSRRLQGRGRRTRSIAIISVLLQPAIILVDYGHFQYNTVMLGLSAVSFSLLYTSLPNPDISSNSSSAKMSEELQKRITSLSRKISYEYIAAAVFFSLSLGFKQMALYYAPAVFAIMLGRCWGLARIGFERGLICFLGIGLATILTFAGMFRSWLTDLSQLGQIIHRIFPIARGLFEDKVSNVWCFLTVLPVPTRYKLRNLMSAPALAKVSLATTLVVILLPCVQLFAAAVETVRIEMFLDQDIKRQIIASEKRIIEGSVAGSSRARNRKVSQAAPSEAGSDLASILSGARGGGTSTIRGGTESRGIGPILDRKAAIVASSSPSPAASLLPYALLSTSLAFFLFGFQTHEKSILLPLLPLTLLMSTKGDEWGGGAGKTDWEWAVLTNNIAVFSMWPLLKRDDIPLQYFTLMIMWNWCIGHQPFSGLRSHRQTFVAWFGAAVHLAMICLHLLEFISPSFPAYINPILARYPDLFPVLNVLLCTPCLLLVWLWSIKRQVEVGFASGIDILSLQGKGSSKAKSKAKGMPLVKTS